VILLVYPHNKVTRLISEEASANLELKLKVLIRKDPFFYILFAIYRPILVRASFNEKLVQALVVEDVVVDKFIYFGVAHFGE
jgi:hypothetical protein